MSARLFSGRKVGISNVLGVEASYLPRDVTLEGLCSRTGSSMSLKFCGAFTRIGFVRNMPYALYGMPSRHQQLVATKQHHGHHQQNSFWVRLEQTQNSPKSN